VAEKITMLEKQFKDLHKSLLFELTEGEGISVTTFFQTLEMLPIAFHREYQEKIRAMKQKIDPESCGTAKVTSHIFLHYSPLFTFLDYGLLKYLISEFGKVELKERMAAYVPEVEKFKRETTVADVMGIWPGNADIPLDYTILRTRFKGEPATYTLEKLDNFRRRFCSHLRLSEFIFYLIAMEPAESFFIIWYIPTIMVPDLITHMDLIEDGFYLEENILSLTLIDHDGVPFHVSQ
jgi:hypothetical protein